MSGPMLTDALGPRGRRRVIVASVVVAVGVVAAVAVGVQRLADNDQLTAEKWRPLTEWAVLEFLLGGLLNTVKAAAAGMVLALAVGGVMAMGRLSRRRPLRWAASTYVEFFRGFPLLLLILFSVFGLRRQGVDISTYSALVLALALYNSAILAEIIRAGILSLDRGQGEAAVAVGLTEGQAMRLVILPQALYRMIPALVGQIVVLLKDTSLGYFVQYEELLRRGQVSGNFDRNLLQALVGVAVIYILVNMALSQLARRLEVRQQRRYRAGSIAVGGHEELTALATSTSGGGR